MLERALRIPTSGAVYTYGEPVYHAGIAHGFIGGIIIMLLIAVVAFHNNGWRRLTMQQRLKKVDDMV
jgi:hypothetical protein